MFYNIHCHHAHKYDNETAFTNVFANEDIPENSFFSAGFHPWQKITDTQEYYEAHLISKLQHQNCVALGEIGLDKIQGVPWNIQKYRFQTQLEIGKNYSKPLVIHCVKAYYEVLNVLNEIKWSTPFIFHGFNKSFPLGKDLLNKGAFLSFGIAILNAKFLQEVFLPLWDLYPNQILLETDTKIMAVQELYAHIAQKLNLDLTTVESIIENTVIKVFGVDVKR